MALETDLWERAGQDLRSTIDDIGLLQADQVTNLSIIARTIAADAAVEGYPCVVICWQDNAEEEGQHGFEDQDVILPYYGFIADRQPGDDQSWRPMVMGWRKQILDTLRPMTRLPNCPEVYDIKLRPMNAIPSSLMADKEYEHMVSGFIIRVYTREVWEHP